MASLERFFPVAESIARLLHPHAEVVVHDVRANTIAAIYNPLSRRQVGDDSLLEDLAGLGEGADVLGPYDSRLFDGRRTKYVSTVLRDGRGRALGLLCVNLDVSRFEQMASLLEAFVGPAREPDELDALFEDDWQRRINAFVHEWLAARQLALEALDRTQRVELVDAMHEAGAFRAKNAAAFAARVLGVSRATVYNDLAQLGHTPAQRRNGGRRR